MVAPRAVCQARGMKQKLHTTLLAVAFLLLTQAALAGPAKWGADAKGVALSGHDVVAYHTQAEAVRGRDKHEVRHDGARFHFATAAHASLFKADPNKYLPKFDGYCAFAVAMKNAKVPANPKTFKLLNGDLLLFYDGPYEGKRFNTKVPWNQSETQALSKANRNWKALSRK